MNARAVTRNAPTDTVALRIDAKRINDAVAEVIERDEELGLQLAVAVGGTVVVDISAGIAHPATGRPVDSDTLFNIFSATKAVTAVAAHVQAERGFLEYDRRVSDYWPEFGVHGKRDVTVGDALLHRAGIPCMPSGITVEQMCDWDHMVKEVAALEPALPPGTRSAYHAYTFGWLIGELVKRTDPARRPFNVFVQEEVCQPLGMTNFWIGLPAEVELRVATLQDRRPPVDASQGNALRNGAIPPHLGTTPEVFGRSDVRRSCHPAAGGIGTAHSLALMYSMLAAGGSVSGTRYLSASRVQEAAKVHVDEIDAALDRQILKGLGFWIAGSEPPGPTSPMGTARTSFGHPGAGGSIGWADSKLGIGVAIVKNRMLAPKDAGANPLTRIGDSIRLAVEKAT